jgi:hypothetical protein
MKSHTKTHFKWQRWLNLTIVSVMVVSLLTSPYPVMAVDAPTPLTPTNGLVTTVDNHPPQGIPEFSWTSIEGSTRYRIQFSQTIGFSTVKEFTTPHTTYTPITVSDFPDGIWYWRVRVDAPSASSYSTTMQFTKQWASATNKPTLVSPGDGASIEFYDAPVFTWQPVVGAAGYRLEIDNNSDFTVPDYTKLDIVQTSHQPETKLANGVYYWRVIPVDPANRYGTPSSYRSFSLAYGIASQGSSLIPTLLSPQHNATPTFTPTFHWTAVRAAQFYRLQYSTDPSMNANVTTVDTRNTTYTPLITLPNDVNYYWRVRTHSGNSISDWSAIFTFRKQWYIQPKLLTPSNNYQHVRFPHFSWTPVPGASYYKVEVNTVNSFPGTKSGTTANTFWEPDTYEGGMQVYYWRVTPFDKNNNQGLPSQVFSYRSYYTSTAPHQIYPLYYYNPNEFPPPYQNEAMNPHEDRTVALPIFMWHRVYYPTFDPNAGEIFGGAYRLQVSSNALFSSIDWQVDTENLSAIPTSTLQFSPTVGIPYYWRVRPLTGIGGAEIGEWSQRWVTKIDLSQGLTPTGGNAPQLIRPEEGYEFAEMTPLLEWFPLSGADSYDVEISTDPNFGDTIDSATVSYPAYAPTQVFAQRNLSRLDYGTFYWRVRGRSGGSPLGNWSTSQRFSIASQSQWQNTRTLGDTANQLQIGQDPSSDVGDLKFDLTTLYSAQDLSSWYFGFNVISTTNMIYALYLDVDHIEGSGATTDAQNLNVSTISTHRPEFAIYIPQNAGNFSAGTVAIHAWIGGEWGIPDSLSMVGGELHYDPVTHYIEIAVPNTAIGMSQETGSYAVSLFSVANTIGAAPQDTVPSDPNVPGSGVISRFASVTERMNQRMPPNDAGIDPTTFSSILPFFWDWPLLAPWSGAYMNAYLDPEFTNSIADYTLTTSDAYFASTSHPWVDDFLGDNTYYWRIRPRYRVGNTLIPGAWTEGMRFEREGFIPQDLQESVTFATPTFSWNMVEGAESYDIQVDNDPSFGSTVVDKNTTQTSYTDINTLSNGTYYWRVRARRRGNVTNEWSSTQNFELSLPQPTNLTPNGSNVNKAPTLCWDPVVVASGGEDVLAAYKYRVQVSQNPSFSPVFDTVDTEQACWTPTKGYDDGTYYWQVAMIDGQTKPGDFSEVATFTKQYPVTTLISPIDDSTVASTPTFIWTPVYGAASYRLEVSLYENFSSLYDSVTTHNTRYTPTKVYESEKVYYWRVAIIDRNLKYGPFNDAQILIGNANKIYIPLVMK